MKKLIASTAAASAYLALAKAAFAANEVVSPVGGLKIGDIFSNIFTLFIALVGGLAIIFIVIGGIRYIMAGGDPKATDSARDQITGALIGLIIALLAVVIVQIVGGFFGVGNLNLGTGPTKCDATPKPAGCP